MDELSKLPGGESQGEAGREMPVVEPPTAPAGADAPAPQAETPPAAPAMPSRQPTADTWAPKVDRLKVGQTPPGAAGINVDGRRTSGALQGFGQLWQKTYQVRLSGAQVSPQEVMQVWKAEFPTFQPPENRFFPGPEGIKPGEILLIEGKVPAIPGTPSIMPVSSGVMVLYADDVSFTVMTPEGFPEAGWNTFSAFEEDGVTVIQVQSMGRAADPLYEFYFRFLGSSAQQEKTWQHVLAALATRFGVSGEVSMAKTCVDPQLQWRQARNIFRNAAIGTVFYKLGAPLRWVGLGKRRIL